MPKTIQEPEAVINDVDKKDKKRDSDNNADKVLDHERNHFIQEQVEKEDIYDYAHYKVKEIIDQEGKYNFQTTTSSPNLESRPVKTYGN